MKTGVFCIGLILLSSIQSFSQDVDVTNLAKLTLLNPGFSYEARVGKFQTVYVQPFVKTSFHTTAKSFIFIPYNIHAQHYFDPALTVQFRQYYLTKKQIEAGKDHHLNSMNYITLYEEIFLSKKSFYQNVTSRRAYNRIALAWGMQKNIAKRFSFNLNLGYGYFFPLKPFYYTTGEKMEETLRDAVLVQMNLGWLLKAKGN